jgi:release factor glutamine methyltransferase
MPSAVSIGSLQKSGPLDPLETRILLRHALGITRIQLITESERVLSSEEAALVASLVQRRRDGEPIAYIIGVREFYGLPFEVTPDVLIPRPETELLVDLALEGLPPEACVLDMGTGSGAIAIALAHQRRDVKVTAIDFSNAALAVARRNAEQLGATVEFLHSDWYTALANRQFDLIVSNPPYIVSGDPHLAQGDLRFEPVDALTDHADGLSALRSVIRGSPARLTDGGRLLVEHGYNQSDTVRRLLTTHGFMKVQSWRDLAGIERVSGGGRP